MSSLTLARDAMQVILQNVPQQTLQRTTYCAMVVKLATGVQAVVVAEAGATASGINGRLVDLLDNQLCGAGGVAIIPCADPTPGQGTWHMNDAEQQALRTVQNPGNQTFVGATIKAVVANRPICAQCSFSLGQLGLTVTASEAVAP